MALLFALACGLLAYAAFRRTPDHVADFDQLWYGAQALWRGDDPYALVGPGRAFDFPWPLYYPLPALLIVSPLIGLPLFVARAVFVAVSAGLLSYGVTRHGWRPLLIFTSASYLMSLTQVQWAPLFVAALFLPLVGLTLVAKPNVGAVVAASPLSGRLLLAALAGGATLTVASFLLMPGWYTEWTMALGSAPHIQSFLVRPGGVLLLAALAKWRRPEARLLAALAVVPQHATLYDTLPLFVIPATLREAAILALASHGAWHLALARRGEPTSMEISDANALTFLLLLYLPALVMVLRRPNEGTVPHWLERSSALLPAVLRGRAPNA